MIKILKRRWFTKKNLWMKRLPFRGLLRLSLGIGGIVLAIWLGSQLIMNSNLFRLKHLDVSEPIRIRSQEIKAIFDPAFEHNLLSLDLKPFMQKLLSHPWVREVRIRKMLPDTLLVDVKERSPVVLLYSQRRLYWIDAAGVVLGPAQEGLRSLPQIKGVALEGLKRKDTHHLKRFQTGLSLIQSVQGLSEELTPESEIIVDLSRGSRDPRLYFQGYTLRLGEGAYKEKWKRFLAIKRDMQTRGLAPDEIDLRFDDQVIVRPS